MSLARAQSIIALDWVSFCNQNVKPKPKAPPPPPPPPPPPQSGPPDEGVVHPGAFCSPEGATGHTTKGTPMVCEPASDNTTHFFPRRRRSSRPPCLGRGRSRARSQAARPFAGNPGASSAARRMAECQQSNSCSRPSTAALVNSIVKSPHSKTLALYSCPTTVGQGRLVNREPSRAVGYRGVRLASKEPGARESSFRRRRSGCSPRATD